MELCPLEEALKMESFLLKPASLRAFARGRLAALPTAFNVFFPSVPHSSVGLVLEKIWDTSHCLNCIRNFLTCTFSQLLCSPVERDFGEETKQGELKNENWINSREMRRAFFVERVPTVVAAVT